jgi:hypothetical protein
VCHNHLLGINNDGEAQAIVQPGCIVARGDQYVSQDLSDALREAIQYEQENYWVGLPCDVCATEKWYHKIKHLVRPDYEYLTKAVVTTNRNWKLFTKEFPKAVKNKKVYWVGSKNHNLDNLNKELEINIKFLIRTPEKNAWSEFETIKTRDEDFNSGDIFVLSCGPLSRVLSRLWFEHRPDCTFLDVGSAFDPWTRNVWHNCHKGTLNSCKGCN